jgi:hypothetical protein
MQSNQVVYGYYLNNCRCDTVSARRFKLLVMLDQKKRCAQARLTGTAVYPAKYARLDPYNL